MRKKLDDGMNDFTSTLKDGASVLAVIVAPILSIWLDYPVKIPEISLHTATNLLLTLFWSVFLAYLYYRRKLNRIYGKVYKHSAN